MHTKLKSNSSASERESGNILLGLLIATMISLTSFYLFKLSADKETAQRKAIRFDQLSNDMQSAVDTFVAIFRQAESNYVSFITSTSCSVAKPFYIALTKGSGCSGLDHSTFVPSEVASGGPAQSSWSCVIGTASSRVADQTVECLDPKIERPALIRLTDPTHQIGGRSFEFWIESVRPQEKEIVFRVRAQRTLPNGTTEKEERTIYFSPMFGSLAHIDHSSRVIRDRSDPIHPCGAKAWDLVRVLTQGQCLDFGFLAGGTALAYFKGNFFGLHRDSGTILLLDPSRTSDPRVDPQTGRLVGAAPGDPPVLFPYSTFHPSTQDLLRGIDDFTITNREIYYAKTAENQPVLLRVISSRTNGTLASPSLCDLSAMGWGQSFEGIAATSATARLFTDTGGWAPISTPPVIIGLKNINGALVYIAIKRVNLAPDATRPAGSMSGVPVNCYAFYSEEEQQVDFKRTFGIDRVGDAKPYYAF